MKFLLDFYGITIGFLWDSYGFSMIFLFLLDSYDTSMRFLWDLKRICMVLL